MDSETIRRRSERFHKATVEAFRVVTSKYDLQLAESGTDFLVFESTLVRMLVGIHRGEIDVGFALLGETIERPAVNLWLSQVLRFTAPDVAPACPAGEQEDLEGQLQGIAEQVDSFCQPVLRGDTKAVHSIRSLIAEDSIAYTRRFTEW